MEVWRKTKMNILLINYEFPPIGGGAANATYFIAKALADQNHQVTILTSAYKHLKGKTLEDGVTIYRVPSGRELKDRGTILQMARFVLSSSLIISKIIRTHNIETSIAFFTIPSGVLSYILHKIYKIPYVISLRGGDVPAHVPELEAHHRRIKLIRQKILASAKKIIANSNSLANLSQTHDPFEVAVVANGVDIPFFNKKLNLENSINNSEHKIFNLLYVGRLHREKNVAFIIENLNKIIEKRNNYLIHLHIVGDGLERSFLESEVQKYHLEKKVTFYGWLEKPEILKLYQSADCVVNPSYYEGMSNVILEAMACHIPVLASKVSGNTEIVTHEITGYLFELNNELDFQKYLIQLIDNEQQRKEMGINARQIAEAKYSWQSVANQYVKFLQ